MSLPNTSSTSASHTADQAPNASSQQCVGNPSNSDAFCHSLFEQTVKRGLETNLKELSTTITAQFNKALDTMTAEVNRLKKISQCLEFGPNQAPTRALKAVLPKIIIALGEDDLPKMSALGPEGILERLGLLSNPYNQITSVRVYPHTKEMHLTTQSRPIYRQLIQDNNLATLTIKLGLTPSQSCHKPEKYWVILNEYNLTNEYLKNCAVHLFSMRCDTGLDIREVKYTQQKLLWSFTDADEAMKACQQPLFFAGDYALAMAYDPRGTPQFCLRCGRPDHTRNERKCPNSNLSQEESWPCIVCAQKHPGRGANSLCPNRFNKALFRCLNCIEASLDDINHRTDFYKCPAPITVSQRAIWKHYAGQLPEWAASMKFPSTNELRARVEKGDLPTRSRGTKSSANTDSLGQAEGSGAGSGTRILNRKGLMKPKKTPKSSSEEQAAESDDDVVEIGATQAAIRETSNPSRSTTIDHSSRKTGQILDWAKPIGGTPKGCLNTPPSSFSSIDAISPAHKKNVVPKRPRGRPKGSLGKKRARAESESNPQGSPSKRRFHVFNDQVPSSSTEPVSTPVDIFDDSQLYPTNVKDNVNSFDWAQGSDYETASMGGSEDGDE